MTNARKALLGTAAGLGVLYLVWLTLKVMDALPAGPVQSSALGFGLFAAASVLALPILGARSPSYRRWKERHARAKNPHLTTPRMAVGNSVDAKVYAPRARREDPVGQEPTAASLSDSSSPSLTGFGSHSQSADATPRPEDERTPPPVAVHEFNDPFALYREPVERPVTPSSSTDVPAPSGRTGSFGRVRAPFLDKPAPAWGVSAFAQRAAPAPRPNRLPAPAPARSGMLQIPVVVPEPGSPRSDRDTGDVPIGVETPIGQPVVTDGAAFAMDVDEHGADHIEHALECLEREIIDNGALPRTMPAPRPPSTPRPAPTAQRRHDPILEAAAAAFDTPGPLGSPHGEAGRTQVLEPVCFDDSESLEDMFQQAVDHATRDLTKAAAVARLRALKTRLVPETAAVDTTRQVPLSEVMAQMEAMRAADPEMPESIEDALASTRVQAAPTLQGLLALSVDLGLDGDDAPSAAELAQTPDGSRSGDRARTFEPEPFRTGVGSLDKETLNALWRDFAQASQECGRNPAMLRNEVFRDHVVRNHDAICRRFGVARVAFSVKIKSGRPTLSAKPLSAQTTQTA